LQDISFSVLDSDAEYNYFPRFPRPNSITGNFDLVVHNRILRPFSENIKPQAFSGETGKVFLIPNDNPMSLVYPALFPITLFIQHFNIS